VTKGLLSEGTNINEMNHYYYRVATILEIMEIMEKSWNLFWSGKSHGIPYIY
jgi:acetylglutamate synthase